MMAKKYTIPEEENEAADAVFDPEAVPYARVSTNFRELINEGNMPSSYLVSMVQSMGVPLHPNVPILVTTGGAYIDPQNHFQILLYPIEQWEFAKRCRTPLMIGLNDDNTLLAVRFPLFTTVDDEKLELGLYEDRVLSQ